MQYCFILDNSLTMLQKSSNEISFIDQAKNSLDSTFKYLYRSTEPQDHQIIHLFVTSSTRPISSYEHNDLHLFNQVKNIECTIPTFPAEVIESALFHIGRFRCLNQSETMLGYRTCSVSEPMKIVFIIDKSNKRQTKKIIKAFQDNRFQIRAEYQFLTIKLCSPSSAEKNVISFENFKKTVQNNEQTQAMSEFMEKINGSLKIAYNAEELNQILFGFVLKDSPTLSVRLQHKTYAQHHQDLQSVNLVEKTRLETTKKKLKEALKKPFFVDLDTSFKTRVMPIPFHTSQKYDRQSGINILEKLSMISFFVDFEHQYTGELLKVFYESLSAQIRIKDDYYRQYVLSDICQFQKKTVRFPVFYEKNGQQYMIGLLELQQRTQLEKDPSNYLMVSFPNFLILDSIHKTIMQERIISRPQQERIYHYMQNLPLFYHTYLQSYIKYTTFQNIIRTEWFADISTQNSEPIGINNMKLFQHRLAEKNKTELLYRENLQLHLNDEAQCCAIYSNQYDTVGKNKSKFGDSALGVDGEVDTRKEIKELLSRNIDEMSEFKKSIDLRDYFYFEKTNTNSMKKELEKYNIRREDDELNESAGNLLGNPFKKGSKRAKPSKEEKSPYKKEEKDEDDSNSMGGDSSMGEDLFNRNSESEVSILSEGIEQGQKEETQSVENSEISSRYQVSEVSQSWPDPQFSQSVQPHSQVQNPLQGNEMQSSNNKIAPILEELEDSTNSKSSKPSDYIESSNKKQILELLEYVNERYELDKTATIQVPAELVEASNEMFKLNKKVISEFE